MTFSKAIPVTTALVFLASMLFSQNDLPATADLERVAVTPIVPNEITDVPNSCKQILVDRLRKLANTHGFGGVDTKRPQFVLVARPQVVEKDITATAPALIKIEVETTIYLADYQTKTVFATTSVSTTGLGKTDIEAYNEAFRAFKANSPELSEFMNTGRSGLISFYNSRCDFILGKADMLNGTGQSDEALSMLFGIPEVCKSCFEKAAAKTPIIYQASLERNCKALVQNARSKWAARPNRSGAEAASAMLAFIPADTKCAAEGDQLLAEIQQKMLELEKWDRKVYTDKREMEMKYLEAVRDIGVAWAENRPDNVVVFEGWLW